MADKISVCVAGGGSWGTALGHLLARGGHDVSLWLRDEAVASAINQKHENPRYLPGLSLDPRLAATTDPAVLARPLVVLAVPCQQLRRWLVAHARHFQPGVVLVNAAKGIETGSLSTCAEITAQELGGLNPRYAVLSGPSFAADVLRDLPTAVVLASCDEALGRHLRGVFSGDDLAALAEKGPPAPCLCVLLQDYQVIDTRSDGRMAQVRQTWLVVAVVKSVATGQAGGAAVGDGVALLTGVETAERIGPCIAGVGRIGIIRDFAVG